MASSQSSEMKSSKSDRILSYAGKHCLLSSTLFAALPPAMSSFHCASVGLGAYNKTYCLLIHGSDAYYCLLEAIAEIERILNPYGKIASKLRFVAVVLYKTTKIAASNVGHASATVMHQD